MLAVFTRIQSAFATLREDRGASLVEYALLVVLIAIVAILAVRFAGEQVSQTFSNVGSELSNP